MKVYALIETWESAEDPSKNKREVSRVYFTRSYTTNKLTV